MDNNVGDFTPRIGETYNIEVSSLYSRYIGVVLCNKHLGHKNCGVYYCNDDKCKVSSVY